MKSTNGHHCCFLGAGNEVGEPVIAERMIRIADNPVLQSMSDPGNGIHLRERDERGNGEEEDDVEKDSKLLSEVSEREEEQRQILH